LGPEPAAVFVDEIAQWATTAAPKGLWEAVSTAAAKKPDSRLIVLTTARDPAHWSHKILQHAVEDPLWRVNEVPGPPPWMDRARIAEQERRLPSSSFLRLFQNEWTADEDRLTNLDDLAACVVLDGPLPPQPNVKYVIGVDIGLRRDRTVACVCHAERLDGRPLSAISDQMSMDADPFRGVRVVLDRIQVWAGSSDSPVQLAEVEVWLNEAVDIFNHARIVIDPWQAVGMAQRLRGRGVAVQEFNFTSASVGQSHQRSTSYSATAPLHCPTTRLCSTSLPMCDFERQHQASTGWTTTRTSTTTGLSP
jgi:phage terminase large subunit-like protein